jgi:hypothetical protein
MKPTVITIINNGILEEHPILVSDTIFRLAVVYLILEITDIGRNSYGTNSEAK